MGCKTSKQTITLAMDTPMKGRKTSLVAAKQIAKITDSPPLITRSTIWYAGEPEIEPFTGSNSGCNEYHDQEMGLEFAANREEGMWTRSAIMVDASNDLSSDEINDFPGEHEPDAEQDGFMTHTTTMSECSSTTSTMTPKDPESADAVSDVEIRQAVVAAVAHGVPIGATELAFRLPQTPPPTLANSAATSRSATRPLDEQAMEETTLPAESEPDAEQDASINESSSAPSAFTSRDPEAQSELEIRQAVVAAVAHAVAFGAMKAALQEVTPSPSAAISKSETGPSPGAASNAIPVQTGGRRSANKGQSARHLKMLAWCCK